MRQGAGFCPLSISKMFCLGCNLWRQKSQTLSLYPSATECCMCLPGAQSGPYVGLTIIGMIGGSLITGLAMYLYYRRRVGVRSACSLPMRCIHWLVYSTQLLARTNFLTAACLAGFLTTLVTGDSLMHLGHDLALFILPEYSLEACQPYLSAVTTAPPVL